MAKKQKVAVKTGSFCGAMFGREPSGELDVALVLLLREVMRL